jgi:hypothetical protein
MKRFVFSAVVVLACVSIATARGPGGRGGNGNSGASRSIGGSSRSVSGGGFKQAGSQANSGGFSKQLGSQAKSGGITKQIGDAKVGLGGKSQTSDKLGDKGQNFDKRITTPKSVLGDKAKVDKGNAGTKIGKIGDKINGNKNVAKLPGFKTDSKKHNHLLHHHKVPHHLHNHCFFHHDFCWNHTCWFGHHNCCGYWHPHARCWYYWYAPYHCYLPITYFETYQPVAVVQPVAVQQAEPVVVNVTTTASANAVADEDAEPALPPGASAVPAGVNPAIPAPRE